MARAPSLIINLPGYPFDSFPSVASVVALRALPSAPLKDGDDYAVDGATVPGDGGGGLFAWNDSLIAADDGSTVIRPNDTSSGQAGRWVITGKDAIEEVVQGLSDTLQYASSIEARAATATDRVMSPATVAAQVATKVTYVNPLEPRFNGGAHANGIDDDWPAVQAAVASYSPASGVRGGLCIKLPPITRLSQPIDVTGKHGLIIEGDGVAMTQIRCAGAFPAIRGTDPATASLDKPQFRNFWIYGGGKNNSGAYGFDLGSTYAAIIENILLWNCEDAFRARDSFGSTVRSLYIHGTSDSNTNCKRGVVLLDGTAGVQENGWIFEGGYIANCSDVGIRGEQFSGSRFTGTEVGNSAIGWDFGDSPSGKQSKWLTLTGCLADAATTHLMRFRKGRSALMQEIHVENMWMGSSGGSPGYGAYLEDITGGDSRGRCYFGFKQVGFTRTAVYANRVKGISFGLGTINDYDRGSDNSAGMVLQDSTDSTVFGGVFQSQYATNTAPRSIYEIGSSARNQFIGISAEHPIDFLQQNGSRTIGCTGPSYGGPVMPLPDSVAEFAKTNLPDPTIPYHRGGLIMVSNEIGGYVPAFCDGTNWRRVTDRAVVS